MYRYLDRSVVTLDSGSRFLLWAIRHGAAAITGKRCIGAAIGPGFTRYGTGEALPAFAMAMALLLRESRMPLDLMAPCCGRVSEHEAVLLTLFGAVEPGGDTRVAATLPHLVADPQTAAALHRAMRTVTAKLLAAGLVPAIPDIEIH